MDDVSAIDRTVGMSGAPTVCDMTGWRRDDPFQLELEHPPREPWPVRDSTGGVATRSAPPDPQPDVLSELKLLAVAAIVGMSLAVATVFVLRAMTAPDAVATAPSEQAPSEQAATPAPAAAEADLGSARVEADRSAPEAVAPATQDEVARNETAAPTPDPVDDEATPPLLPAQLGLAAVAANVGAEADRAASEAAPAIADERTRARLAAAEERDEAISRAEAEVEADAEASEEDSEADEDAESVHAAQDDDDIIDLDEPDPEDDAADDDNVSWSEVQARYDRLRGKSTTSERSKKRDARKRKTKKREAKKETRKDEPEEASQEVAQEAGPAGAFDRDAATSAMFGAAGGASSCATEGGPSGRGRVSVTLSPSGRVSSVDVGGPFAGTKTGSCIASLFRSISVPPFTGGAVALQKSFHVKAAKAATSSDDEPKKARSKAKKAKKKTKKPSKRRSGRRRGRARR